MEGERSREGCVSPNFMESGTLPGRAGILSPSGTMLFDIPLAADDIDESLELPSPPIVHPSVSDAETRIEVEDALGELETTEAQEQKVNAHILVNGKGVYRILNAISKTKILVLTAQNFSRPPQTILTSSLYPTALPAFFPARKKPGYASVR